MSSSARQDLIRPRPLALVTGASSGMGEAFARLLAEAGHDLLIIARRRERLEALALGLQARFGIRVEVLALDLGRDDAVDQVAAALGDRPVALLVHAAGFSIAAPFARTDWSLQRDCLMTLAVTFAGLCRLVLPGMIAAGEGGIIGVSSVLALGQGGPGHTLYPAAKSFVRLFLLSLDAEVRKDGVRVTCVMPGSTASEFQTANGTAAAMQAMPAFLISTPEQVARASLAANRAGRVTVIPGWHNRLLATFFALAPGWLVRMLSASAAERFARDGT